MQLMPSHTKILIETLFSESLHEVNQDFTYDLAEITCQFSKTVKLGLII